jgi:hypothetical protein
MRAAFAMSFVASVALAQPIDINNGKFRNITVTGTESANRINATFVDAGTLTVGGAAKIAILDAGTGMVNGQLQVSGTLVASGAVNTTGTVTMADNTCRMTGSAATFWFSGTGASVGGIESGMSDSNQSLQNAAVRVFADSAGDDDDTVFGVKGGAAGALGQQFGITHAGKLVFNNDGGADEVAGRAVLVGGTVTVSTTAVESNSLIQLTRCVTGGTVGHLSVGTVTADTSFVINSSSGTDTSTICWWVSQP